MHKLLVAIQKFLHEEDGPTAVEYAVMLALVIIVLLTGIKFIGAARSNTFLHVGSQINSSGS